MHGLYAGFTVSHFACRLDYTTALPWFFPHSYKMQSTRDRPKVNQINYLPFDTVNSVGARHSNTHSFGGGLYSVSSQSKVYTVCRYKRLMRLFRAFSWLKLVASEAATSPTGLSTARHLQRSSPRTLSRACVPTSSMRSLTWKAIDWCRVNGTMKTCEWKHLCDARSPFLVLRT